MFPKLAILVAVPVIGYSANYYVDAANGNDGNPGTIVAPWRSIARVNRSILNPGDTVSFKRGEVWRGEYLHPSGNGVAGRQIVFDAYGTGPKPIFLGSIQRNSPTDWSRHTGNIWRTTAKIQNRDVGQIYFNNEEDQHGMKKDALSKLTVQGDFYFGRPVLQGGTGDSTLYLYSESNPGNYYSSIDLALFYQSGSFRTAEGLIFLYDNHHITIRNISFRRAGVSGIMMRGRTGNSNILVEYCDFAWIGGGYWNTKGPPWTGEGDGIDPIAENYEGTYVTDLTVRYCTFLQCFDSGPSLQAIGKNVRLQRIRYHHNIITRCYDGIDIFTSPTTEITDSIFFENNTIVQPGRGWSTAQRNDSLNNSGFKMNEMYGKISHFYFRNNIIYDPYTSGDKHQNCVKWSYWLADSNVARMVVDHNLYFQPAGTMILYKDWSLYTQAEFSRWKSDHGKDAHSKVGNPLFKSESDFHLQVESPARGAGTDCGYTQDADGVPIAGICDIGAYQYVPAHH